MFAAQAVPLGLFRALVGEVDVDVGAAGAPVSVATVPAGGALGVGGLEGRGPQPAVFEPLQHRVRLRALQLDQGGLQVRRLARAECGGTFADQNGPIRSLCHTVDRIRQYADERAMPVVRAMWSDESYEACGAGGRSRRFSFSTSVVRLRPSSAAA